MKNLSLLCILLSLVTHFNVLANEAHSEHKSDHNVEQKAEQKTEQKVETKSEAHAKEHERKKGDVSPLKALSLLKNGNKRFTAGHIRLDGQSAKDRQRLSTGQTPHTIMISCSDSRVPPEIIFDQKLGEIFVVRTAGESLDSSAIASVEYAVSHLGSNLIVIMGHESCGAVKAALATLKGGDAGSVWLNKLVADLHPHLKRFTDLTPTDGVVVESWANVDGVASDLVERSEIIRKLVNAGEVQIQHALYRLGSGQVEWR